jgi:hypothetical protein
MKRTVFTAIACVCLIATGVRAEVGEIAYGELLDAVLIIDAHFPLPAESYTWGVIKALYR